ncbi:MAG TPA: YqcC family protein [Chloroflexia bacterium]|nr:YqcC family protein [Chloroflexia bacterium]
MRPSYEEVGRYIDGIEAEMKRIGFWRDEPLPAEMYNFTQAFAMDTMPFPYWLQFIFIPRVRSIIAEQGDFPRGSQAGAQAVREFDGVWEASDLVSKLSAFDALFN